MNSSVFTNLNNDDDEEDEFEEAISKKEILFLKLKHQIMEKKNTLISYEPNENWFDPKNINEFQLLYELFGQMDELLDHVSLNEEIEKLKSFLYFLCLSHIRYLSGHLENDDGFQTMPLVNIYLFIARLTHLLHERHLRRDEIELFRTYTQAQIKLCIEHKLIAVTSVALNALNMNELLSSLDMLEINLYNGVPFGDELLQYLACLELRICDFLLYTQSIDNHCVETCRTPLGDDYCCRSSAEYMLVIRILSIRKELEGSLHHLRNHEDCVRNPFPEEMETCKVIYHSMLYHAQKIHGDIIQNKFVKAYELSCVPTSIGYMWLQQNGFGSPYPDPGPALTQYFGSAFWKATTEKSHTSIDRHFFEMSDLNAFWLAFYYIVEMLMESSIKMPWNDEPPRGCYVSNYFISNQILKTMSMIQKMNLDRASHRCPRFVQCFTDAGVLFRGKLYIFGNKPIDYIRALFNWILIIDEVFEGMFEGKSTLIQFKKLLFDEEGYFKAHIQFKKYQDQEEKNEEEIERSHDLIFKSAHERLVIETQKRIQFVISTQKSCELEVSNIYKNLEGVGLETSTSSSSSIWE